MFNIYNADNLAALCFSVCKVLKLTTAIGFCIPLNQDTWVLPSRFTLEVLLNHDSYIAPYGGKQAYKYLEGFNSSLTSSSSNFRIPS